MKNIEKDGVWFLPNNPEKQVYGKLTFSTDESPKLFLFDQLQEVKFHDTIPIRLDFEIINGYLVDGQKVTLCHCYQPIEFKTGIQTSTIHARYLLIGHQFKTLKEIVLKGVSVRYKNLEEWINLPNFEINWSINEERKKERKKERKNIKEINVKQKTLEPIELGKLLDFSIILYDETIDLQKLQIANFIGRIGRKISLEEKKSITFRTDSEKSLEEIINVIYLFQELLIFASGQMTYPYNIQSIIKVIEKDAKIPEHVYLDLITGSLPLKNIAKSELGFEIKAFEEEKEKLVAIEIYFNVGKLDNLDAKFDSQRVLFCFKDVKEQFDELLNLWERNSKDLEPIIDLYLRLMYVPRRHINDFFLSLAQAIEAFHSLAHDGSHLDKQVYKSVIRKTLEKAVDSIPDFVPSDNEQDSVDLRKYKMILKKEKLSHLNSYSLRERLEEIISEYRSCLPDNFFASSDEQNDFLKKIRKTRNYLTHLSSKKDKDVLSGQNLLLLTQKLKMVLEICLLKQLGLEDLDIKKMISENR